ncbi:MAG: hypothetical protein ACI8W3_002988 [Myxococcota bacterium]|jgi:hypothetical protein
MPQRTHLSLQRRYFRLLRRSGVLLQVSLHVVALAIAGLAAAESASDQPAAQTSPSTVILISLDGTRPVDIGFGTLPSLVALSATGVVAEGLVPATPANTFPSHVTMVTGVEPDRHGIVNNFFIDPERGAFKKKDIPSWIQVEPLWSLLGGHGIVSASYHWVGSEGPWQSGRGPKYWHAFRPSTPTLKKAEAILAWLDLSSDEERPQFITAWFPGADHAAHRDGPGSEASLAQLARHEPALQTLIRGIGGRGLWESVTLIVVSDHGMAAAETKLDFDRVLDAAGVAARVTGMGGFASVYFTKPKGNRGDIGLGTAATPAGPDAAHAFVDWRTAVFEQVERLASQAGVEVVRRGEAPGESVFTNPRFGDMVVRAPVGTAFHRPGLPSGGFHGYVSSEPAMHGIFIAAGRGVAEGLTLPLLRGIDIAPTVLKLLEVPQPDWMHGTPIQLDPTRTPLEQDDPS